MWSKMDRERKKKLQQQQIQEQLNASTSIPPPAAAAVNPVSGVDLITDASLAPVPMDVEKEDGQI